MMNHKLLRLLTIAAVSGTLLAGCSRHKGPAPAAGTAAPAASTATTAAPASPAGAAPAASTVPTSPAAPAASAPAAAPAAGSAATAPVQSPAQQPDLILLAGSAFDGCTAPALPPDPPDGHVATKEQMLASHTLTANFNSATNDYLACLDQAANNFSRQYGRALQLRGMRQVAVMHDRFHNQAVETDHTVADKFNKQLRIYKARGGAS